MSGHRAGLRRGLGLGVATCAGLIWTFLFATAGTLEVVTLLVTVALLVWFGTVDPLRLVDDTRRPLGRLFLLAGLGLALLTSALVALGSATMLLTLTIGLSALITGAVRAVRVGMTARS